MQHYYRRTGNNYRDLMTHYGRTRGGVEFEYLMVVSLTV